MYYTYIVPPDRVTLYYTCTVPPDRVTLYYTCTAPPDRVTLYMYIVHVQYLLIGWVLKIPRVWEEKEDEGILHPIG